MNQPRVLGRQVAVGSVAVMASFLSRRAGKSCPGGRVVMSFMTETQAFAVSDRCFTVLVPSYPLPACCGAKKSHAGLPAAGR